MQNAQGNVTDKPKYSKEHLEWGRKGNLQLDQAAPGLEMVLGKGTRQPAKEHHPHHPPHHWGWLWVAKGLEPSWDIRAGSDP